MLTKWMHTLIDTLVASGVRDFVISPGSRSTPLAIAAFLHPSSRTHVLVDERSASFFALGLTRTEERVRPVALICTSGTAATNYYSAVTEANIFELPLIVLTADRPHELRNVGAPQAIDQVGLYGKQVRHAFDLPLAEEASLPYVAHVAQRATLLSLTEPAGPVQINVPLREPLVPELDLLRTGRSVGVLPEPTSGVNNALAIVLQKERLLFVLGPQLAAADSQIVISYAKQAGIPVLADPLSQGRQSHDDHVFAYYDTWLKHPSTAQHVRPDRIIRFGAMPTSKPYLLWSRDIPTTVVGHPGNWRDPQLHSDFVIGHARQLEHHEPVPHDPTYLNLLQQAERRVTDAFTTIDQEEMTEYNVVRALTTLQEGSLFVSNSMPIRDIDTFLPTGTPLRLLANRGANGIDGILSSALGATFDAKHRYLLVGDLAFIHDINGLMTARTLPLTIILVNNAGGGIFSFLPQQQLEQAVFEPLFGTPQHLDFASLASGYGVTYQAIDSIAALRQALAEETNVTRILEVKTTRIENVQMHRSIWDVTNQALAEVFR
ncbi:2-succinyl-5-enolpyruvyl-6-hydroxy-3-cyclohexene-1-carboxylic-acid synthase [Exiguobacterium sp. Leaf196]|uniref:2-succinyl-5-enolpyruvyl-6-hydroxy-3- cyclohexene-1-carboxylic-acid synthase n=1 Tax=Exiguobacterium sp. Leaf196 TaxID=1736298 RepID=UPI0006FB3A2E|nr:2-succinyl-5-enolpyruvyl-6-hydroxy-3-cyclohexene-1-carboxylic-acid synthase [Exiguobacterium sp. Leaf196]KQS38070.1 2-succinyl-5-enolpyruvyl-6-hydroxy-3-cyclohexene-1-carboxylate synthase [Exiguobacterium sp. Leaf196]